MNDGYFKESKPKPKKDPFNGITYYDTPPYRRKVMDKWELEEYMTNYWGEGNDED